MRAGELDRTILLEELREEVAASGAVETAWVPIAIARAKITEAVEDAQADPRATAKAKLTALIRWRADVTTAQRITYQGQVYAITSLVEVGRRRGLELQAVAT